MSASYNMVATVPTPPIVSEEMIDADDQGDKTPPQVIPYKTAISEPVRRNIPVQSKDLSDTRIIFDLGSWYNQK